MSDTAGSRNHGAVDQLLLEAGMGDDGQLRDALADLRSLAAEAPAPSAEIAALMAGSSHAATPADTTVLPIADRPGDELAARRKAKRRITLTTLSVAASLAAGGAVAAASDQGFRESFSQLNHAVTTFVSGSGATPEGSTGGQVPAPGPAASRPSATSSPDSVPAATAPASAPAAAAPSSIPARPGNTPTHGAPAQKPAEVPAQPSLPADVHGDVKKGLEQGNPKLPVPVPTEIPLPGKVPDVPLK
ncbi:hypothetical protein LFT44_18395 [Arthrobacter sp. FW306-05-C]|uniref:hypothetical protein n=1 Tax=Arthrobacter TaxID=1663 RepID=UPI001EF01187|nr:MULTISPECIES: hypothetical protein [Arthrobacter]MDP9986878.1 hypothetical protein [Arthrobacter oryzae]UKA66433.1 hypothetical protein LFT44_18395 [Arthrobacter sp. FW306-05-C]UKA75108.1 hypothetical protein LFT46_18545 [Arthrobacter sp. FW306-07-I]